MKRAYRLPMMVACAALLAACSNGQEVKGNGTITTQTRDIPSFKKVAIKGDFQVMLVRRWPQKITVSTDKNLQQHILTVVKDGELDIMPQQGYNIKPTRPIMIKVATRNLEEINSKGASTIDATGLNADKFEFTSEGSSRASLAGRVDKADIEIKGAAKIDARNLLAKDVEIDVKGDAQTMVHATKKLDVKITGAGQVVYYGKPPVVNQAIFGGGILKEANKTAS